MDKDANPPFPRLIFTGASPMMGNVPAMTGGAFLLIFQNFMASALTKL